MPRCVRHQHAATVLLLRSNGETRELRAPRSVQGGEAGAQTSAMKKSETMICLGPSSDFL